MKIIFLAFVVIFFVNIASVVSDPLVISLPNGQIRGREIISPNNTTFYGFQGIPYATAPVGHLRFQPPLPAQNWSGVLDATKDGAQCHGKQLMGMDLTITTTESEDCLFINVYTPKLRSNEKNEELLPVMFFIHGGGFITGSSSYSISGPDYFIEEDVVFVSINYRLGPFGFLSTEDTVIPGNAGLKDQNLALKWANENVHLFGGDPSKITIFGQSAGSMSVTYHVLSPLSAGLFRGAIADSGSAVNYCSVNHEQLKYAKYLLSLILINQNSTVDSQNLTSQEMLDIFLDLPADAITDAVNEIETGELNKPTIEVPHDGAFLSESPYVLLDNGTFNQVPILLGYNSEEFLNLMGSVDVLAGVAKKFDEQPHYLLPQDLFLREQTNVTEVTDLIKDIFLDKDQLFQDNLGAAVQYGTDDRMARPIIKHAELHSKYADVFFYQFSYYGKMGGSTSYNLTGELLGKVGHGDELNYMFKSSGPMGDNTDISVYPEQDVITHKRMVKMWTNFVKTLNPTPEKSDLLQNVEWPVVKEQDFTYLDIDSNLTIVNTYPRRDHYTKWSHIFYTYGLQPFYNF